MQHKTIFLLFAFISIVNCGVTFSQITVTSPNGGENWKAGTVHNITWTSNILYKGILIDYSIDNGKSWIYINSISDTSLNASYSWTVPSTPSTNCLVRVEDLYDSTTYGQSANAFTIYSPSITVISPNGGENWHAGSTYNITWRSSYVADVRIDFSTLGGDNWINIVPSYASTGSYKWTIPDTISQNCLVRITDTSNVSVYDESDGIFMISSPLPSITVTSPNGGENWEAGTVHNITWTSNVLFDGILIDYSIDNGRSWNYINSMYDTTLNGSYSWTVPDTSSTNCLVRVEDLYDSTTYGQSANVFTIYSPSITVTSPVGGENWTAGTQKYISWKSSYVNYLNIEYSTNYGDSWNYIAANISADSTRYLWTVPNTPSSICLVLISDAADSTCYGLSDSVFTISLPPPSITVTSPNGGENWEAGTVHNITWTSNVLFDGILIDYSIDNGRSWNYINSMYDTTLNGSYSWTVPDTSSTNCLVRVEDLYDSTTYGQSANVFTIYSPSITVTSPVGGENWAAGTQKYISWKSSYVNYLNIEYSTNYGDSWNYIAANISADSTRYLWTVPNTPSSICLVLISDAADSTCYGLSDSVFTISPPLKPIANFTASPVRGLRPLTVNFSDSSSNGVTRLLWNFGDGSQSLDKNPVHIYDSAGVYSVKLIAAGPGGIDSVTKVNLITVDSLSWTAPRVVNAGDSISISTTIPSYFNPTSYQLFYKEGGQSAYTEENFQPKNDSIRAIIPPSAITIRGIEFYTKISDGKNSITYPQTDPVNHPATINVRIQSVSPTVSIQSSKYEMISLPIDMGNQDAINFLIDAYGTYNKKNWRLLRWNNDSASYLEYPNLKTRLTPGTAFWLITKNGNSFKLSNVQSINTSTLFTVNLGAGWNQIGDPFAFPVAWDNIQNSGLVQSPISWNSSTQEYEPDKTIMVPWMGYWVYNPSAEPITLRIPPKESIPAAKENVFGRLSADEFILQVKAYSSTGGQDTQNYVGMINSKKSGANKSDVLEPPPVSGKINLSIVSKGKDYIENFVPSSTEGAYWDIEIHSDEPVNNAKIEFEMKSSLPQDFKIWFLDKDNMLSIPVVNNAVKLQLPQSGKSSYRLIVGKEEFARKNADKIPLAAPDYSLLQNYPNPFNITTNIVYNLHERSRVRVVVYDILGRQVKVLVNKEFQDPGEHSIIWDGTNRDGNTAASGVYIYRIKANSFIASKMMVLLK